MSKHDEDLLQTRNRQLKQALNNAYVPKAYAQRYDDKFWVFLYTPSAAVVRLYSHYVTIEGAEQAIDRLGLKRVDPPTLTLTRANTTPR